MPLESRCRWSPSLLCFPTTRRCNCTRRASPWSSWQTSRCGPPCRRWSRPFSCCATKVSPPRWTPTSRPSITSSNWSVPVRRSKRRTALAATGSPGDVSSAPPAIVVGLDNITGLQTARILAARGVRVFGIAGDGSHFGSRTRTCERVIVSPLSGRPLIEAIRDLGREWPDGVLLPCTDGAVATLSRFRAELPQSLTLPLASDEVVMMLTDKLRFAEHARQMGLPFPRTMPVASHADVKAAGETVSYPCIVKPAVKTVEWLRRTKSKGFRVDSAEDLVKLYGQIETWSPTFIVQEWVEGAESRLFSCNAYFDRSGQALVTFVARKLRQWPPQVGTSASGEECRNDAVL